MPILSGRKAQTKISLLAISENMPFQYVEAYRSLRTNIRFASVNTIYKRIMVTSAASGEGKSTVAANLAAAFAKMDCKVLLIDCDMRKPILDQYFSIENSSRGLSTALADIVNVDECISFIEPLGIYLLPAGSTPPNPTEMLGSKKMDWLVDTLSAEYDYLIFDTPPVSVVSDAAVLSKLADGVVFIVRQNYTTVETAQTAISNLRAVGANIIGSVLNDYNAKKSPQYDKHEETKYKNYHQ